MISETTKWPRVKVMHGNGSVEYGHEAHRTPTHVTVRFEKELKDEPSPFGLRNLTFLYKDIPAQYVETQYAPESP